MAEYPNYAEAVGRLKDALIEARNTGAIKRMERLKKEVLEDFQQEFALEAIENLSGDKFRDFLKPTKNKHWRSLSRSAHRAGDEGRMPDLRKALAILLNEKEEPSLAKRLDKARSAVKNVGRAVLTAILQVAHPDRFGVWNTRSEDGLNRLGLLPKFKRGTSFGEQYETINNLLIKLRDSVGGIDLWTLDVLWFSLKDNVAEAATAAAEIEQDKDDGYQSDPRIRKAIEMRAMEVAQKHYENLAQYSVVNPEKYRNHPYDMECKKDGRTIHVEVKGTQGSGEKVILTEREVEHAETYPMELCVVWGIKVGKGKASGGTPKTYPEWNPRNKYKLDCIAYRCTLPKEPETPHPQPIDALPKADLGADQPAE